MLNRTLNVLGNVSLAMLFSCLFLALAAMPTAALADVPGDPEEDCAVETRTEGGTATAARRCRVECNVNSQICVQLAILLPPCGSNVCPVPINLSCFCTPNWFGLCVCL